MTQQDVLNLLKNNPKSWFTSRDIALIFNSNNQRVNKNLKSMLKYHEVVMKKEKVGQHWFYYYRLNWRKKFI